MMTLQEKFKQWFIDDEEDEHYEGMVEAVAIEHGKIAEEFAIGFLVWSWEYLENDENDKYSLEQLLEIYKK